MFLFLTLKMSLFNLSIQRSKVILRGSRKSQKQKSPQKEMLNFLSDQEPNSILIARPARWNSLGTCRLRVWDVQELELKFVSGFLTGVGSRDAFSWPGVQLQRDRWWKDLLRQSRSYSAEEWEWTSEVRRRAEVRVRPSIVWFWTQVSGSA